MHKKFKSETGLIKVEGITVYTNDAVNICYEASKSCYAGKLFYERDKRTTYIENRVKEAHESVLEHSNNVYLIRIPRKRINEDVGEFNAAVRYLNMRTQKSGKYFYMLIGGSIRGYKNLIRDMKNQNNFVLVALKELIYESCDAEFFSDLIDSHAMQLERFVSPENIIIHHRNEGYINDKTGYMDYRHRYGEEDESCIEEIINADPIELIYKEVKKYGFTIQDVMSVCSITIKFKNMSRIITQQLTRHRNGITQESQRYVDASGAVFNIPAKFKPDKYDTNQKYQINLNIPDGSTVSLSLTQQELGDILCTVYPQLRDQGMLKEDARYYLPQAVQSSVYMTFTFLSLFQFFKLRLDKAAQAEIRKYAQQIEEEFFTYNGEMFLNLYAENFRGEITSDSLMLSTTELIDYFLIPPYMFSETYGEVDDSEISETLEAPQESIEEMNKLSVEPEGDDEEMKDFGVAGNKAKPMDKSDAAIEKMFKDYNPQKYANTRDDGEPEK